MNNLLCFLFLFPLTLMAQIDLTTKNNIDVLEKQYPWYYLDAGSTIALDFNTTYRNSNYGSTTDALYLLVSRQATAFIAENTTLNLDTGSFYDIEVVTPNGVKTRLKGKCNTNRYSIDVYNPEILIDILSRYRYVTINLKTKIFTMSSVVPCKYFKKP